MISSEKYFRPNIGNNLSIAYGFINVDDSNKPLFILPANCFIVEILVSGLAFTVDGVIAPETDQFVIIGIEDDPDLFVAFDNYQFSKNPTTLFLSYVDIIAGSGGVGVNFNEYFRIGETTVTGTYDKGTSGANGGGPLVVIMKYIKLN